MPVNNFSIGKDITLNIALPNGPLAIRGLTGFRVAQNTTDIRSKALDGRTRHVIFPDSWSGSFMLDRRDGVVDRYFAQLEANYYNGFFQAPISITETIQEADGSISQFRFTGVQLKLSDAGSWSGDALVKMSIDFVAELRKQIS